MIDPLGTLMTELQDYAGLAALVGARIRGQNPHGATKSYEGDALGAGKYKAFVVIGTLSLPPERRTPVTFAEYWFRAYGTDARNARAVYRAIVDAVHGAGPRLSSAGIGIYSTYVTGGADGEDPDTKQPVVTGTIQLIAATRVVTT